MPSRSKTKGNKFENDICKLFNNVYETQEFYRTPSSGAIMGRTNWGKRQGLAEGVKRTLGSDIIVPDWFKFAVECKHYKDTPAYHNLIKNTGDPTVDHWIGEVMYDAINLNLHPMLIFKTDRKGMYFTLPAYFIHALENADIYLKYGTFIIVDGKTYENHAHDIKKCALDQNFEELKTQFQTLPFVKRRLELLEMK